MSERRAARETSAEIAWEGVLAAKTLIATLVVSGVAFIAASWDELWRPCPVVGACVHRASVAGLITLLSAMAIAVGVGLALRLRRRPVEPDGSAGYVIALGVLFALGLALVSARVPAWACARGHFDPTLKACIHPPTRSEATSWVLVKWAIALVGVGIGVAIAFSKRWVKVSAPLAAIAWFGGAGWLLVATQILHQK